MALLARENRRPSTAPGMVIILTVLLLHACSRRFWLNSACALTISFFLAGFVLAKCGPGPAFVLVPIPPIPQPIPDRYQAKRETKIEGMCSFSFPFLSFPCPLAFLFALSLSSSSNSSQLNGKIKSALAQFLGFLQNYPKTYDGSIMDDFKKKCEAARLEKRIHALFRQKHLERLTSGLTTLQVAFGPYSSQQMFILFFAPYVPRIVSHSEVRMERSFDR